MENAMQRPTKAARRAANARLARVTVAAPTVAPVKRCGILFKSVDMNYVPRDSKHLTINTPAAVDHGAQSPPSYGCSPNTASTSADRKTASYLLSEADYIREFGY
jgi:hypothetical protein